MQALAQAPEATHPLQAVKVPAAKELVRRVKESDRHALVELAKGWLLHGDAAQMACGMSVTGRFARVGRSEETGKGGKSG